MDRGRVACTIVTGARIAFARVLARSFRQVHPDIPVVVLVVDAAHGADDPAAFHRTVSPADLGIPGWQGLRFRYDQLELTCATTPWLIGWLLDQGFDRVLFLKQETHVLGDVSPIFASLSDAPVVVTPHLVEPIPGPGGGDREQRVLLAGAYNAGVLGVAEHPTSRRLLAWWQDRLRTHCIRDVSAGMHLEQRWLDLAVGYFEGIRVLHDPAYNVGHWCLPERTIAQDAAGVVTVDGRPVRIFRFSGYRPEEPLRLTMHDDRPSSLAGGPARDALERFRIALEAEGHAAVSTRPYGYADFDNGVPIPAIARALYRELGPAAERFGDPAETQGATSFWRWLTEPAAEGGLSRLWDAVHRSRPDLQRAHPDPGGGGAAAFLQWARRHGAAEHGIAPVLLEPHPR